MLYMNGKPMANYRSKFAINNPRNWDGVWYLNRRPDQQTDPLDACWFSVQVFNQAFTAEDVLFELGQTQQLFAK